MSGERMNSRVYAKSHAVTGTPSDHFAFGSSLKYMVFLSYPKAQEIASSGIILPVLG